MTDFIGGSLLRWMAKPYAAAGKLGLRAFNFTASPFLKIVDRVLGSQVLEDLSALVIDFQNIYDGSRSARTTSCGSSVVRPNRLRRRHDLEGPPLEEAGFFIDRLVGEALHAVRRRGEQGRPGRTRHADPDTVRGPDVGTIVSATTLAGLDARERRPSHDTPTALAPVGTLARRDRGTSRSSPPFTAPSGAVPLLTHDVHDVDGLRELSRDLLGTAGARARPLVGGHPRAP